MKCPYCDGKGYYYQESSYGMELVQCNCQNKMTNEEWLEQASTEEKAKLLRKIYRDGRDDYVGEWYEQTEADFVEWLKEIHDEV